MVGTSLFHYCVLEKIDAGMGVCRAHKELRLSLSRSRPRGRVGRRHNPQAPPQKGHRAPEDQSPEHRRRPRLRHPGRHGFSRRRADSRDFVAEPYADVANQDATTDCLTFRNHLSSELGEERERKQSNAITSQCSIDLCFLSIVSSPVAPQEKNTSTGKQDKLSTWPGPFRRCATRSPRTQST